MKPKFRAWGITDVPIGEIIENSIVEVIGNIYENPELLESVEE
ncbi:YopX family protein [Streptococcus agalactiae]|nr:YopX family protein [Streptococcus agalactiae]